MPDALTLLREFAQMMGGDLREFPPVPGEGAYVRLRIASVELIGRSGSRGGSFDTTRQAADNLVQTLWRWTDFLAEPQEETTR